MNGYLSRISFQFNIFSDPDTKNMINVYCGYLNIDYMAYGYSQIMGYCTNLSHLIVLASLFKLRCSIGTKRGIMSMVEGNINKD